MWLAVASEPQTAASEESNSTWPAKVYRYKYLGRALAGDVTGEVWVSVLMMLDFSHVEIEQHDDEYYRSFQAWSEGEDEPRSSKKRRLSPSRAQLVEESSERVQNIEAALRGMRDRLEDAECTAKARKNVISDQLTRIKKHTEVEQLLREEIKLDRVMFEEKLQAANKSAERAHALADQQRIDILSHAEAKKESCALIGNLEADVAKLTAEVAEFGEKLMAQTRELKKKDAYISELHRGSDEQDNKVRDHKQEVARLVQVIEDGERKNHRRERDFGAKLLSSHNTSETKFKNREMELLARISRLEQEAAVTRILHPHSSSSLPSPGMMKQSSGDPRIRSTQDVAQEDQAQKLKELEIQHKEERKALAAEKDVLSTNLRTAESRISALTKQADVLRQELDSINAIASGAPIDSSPAKASAVHVQHQHTPQVAHKIPWPTSSPSRQPAQHESSSSSAAAVAATVEATRNGAGAQSDADMKLLKANAMLEREKTLLTHRVQQTLSTRTLAVPTPAPPPPALVETFDLPTTVTATAAATTPTHLTTAIAAAGTRETDAGHIE